jgi:hypothetical protein
VDEETKDAFAAIDRAVAWVREQRKTGWPPLSAEYLRAVAAVEALPRNQSGADKSWVWEATVRDLEHFARARRVR